MQHGGEISAPPRDSANQDDLELLVAQFEALIEGAPLAIGLFDPDVRHVRVNPALAAMNGLPTEALLGRRPAELHGAVGEEAEELYRQVMDSGEPLRDVPLSGATGTRPDDERHWRLNVFPIRHGGHIVGLCVIVADVTGERRLGDALRQSEEEQRRLAGDLQQALQPPALPRLAGAELATVYRPMAGGATVGGDFYDVLPLDGSAWALVVGDVQGKGPVAASLTAALRYAIRTATVTTTGPEAILSIVNAVLLREDIAEGLCTVAYVVGECVEDRLQVRAASAGHPLPLVVRAATGAVEVLGTPGTLLGVQPDVDLPVAETTLDEGDLLVLYTDWVTEARYHGTGGRLHLFGDERLRVLLAELCGSAAADVAAALEQAVLDFQTGALADDVAIVVLRVTGGTGAHTLEPEAARPPAS